MNNAYDDIGSKNILHYCPGCAGKLSSPDITLVKDFCLIHAAEWRDRRLRERGWSHSAVENVLERENEYNWHNGTFVYYQEE